MIDKNGIFVLLLLLGLIVVPLVSAQSTFSQQVNSFVNGISEIIEPIAKLLVGDLTGSGGFTSSDVLWSKVLFLILIFSVIYVIFEKVEFFASNNTAHFIIALVVSLLATRWIGDANVIQTILLPYSALGIALSAALPFVAAFVLINIGMKNAASIWRKVAWVFVGTSFIFYWFTRSDDLQGNFKYIYPFTSLVAFIMVWVDGTIKRFFLKVHLQNIGKDSAEDAMLVLETKLNEIANLEGAGILSPEKAAKRRKKIEKRIASLSKYS